MASVCAAKPQPDEIIIVADGGTDDTPLPDGRRDITIIETERRGGPAQARNLGAQHATGDILYFIDADVLIPLDAITQVKEAFEIEPAPFALIGSYDDAPGEINFLSQYRNLLHHYVHQTSKEEAATFWGACGAIHRNTFLEVGGFNELLYDQPAIEDIELGYRLKKAGHKIKLCKQLQVKHLKHWDTLTLLKTDFFHRALPWTELILRNRNFLNDLNTDRKSRMSVVLTFCLSFLLVLSLFHPWFLTIIPPVSGTLFFLNFDVYRFFYRKRGAWFTLQVIPWHWLYYFYSGLAFIVGLTTHFLSKRKPIVEAGASRKRMFKAPKIRVNNPH